MCSPCFSQPLLRAECCGCSHQRNNRYCTQPASCCCPLHPEHTCWRRGLAAWHTSRILPLTLMAQVTFCYIEPYLSRFARNKILKSSFLFECNVSGLCQCRFHSLFPQMLVTLCSCSVPCATLVPPMPGKIFEGATSSLGWITMPQPFNAAGLGQSLAMAQWSPMMIPCCGERATHTCGTLVEPGMMYM